MSKHSDQVSPAQASEPPQDWKANFLELYEQNGDALVALSEVLKLIQTAANLYRNNPMGEWLLKSETYKLANEALMTNSKAFAARRAASSPASAEPPTYEYACQNPDAEKRIVNGNLTPVWKDAETGLYIAEFMKMVASGETPEAAIANLQMPVYMQATMFATGAFPKEAKITVVAASPETTPPQDWKANFLELYEQNGDALVALSEVLKLIQTAANLYRNNPMGEWLLKSETYKLANEALMTNSKAFAAEKKESK